MIKINNYYGKQLSQLNPSEPCRSTIKLWDHEGKSTKTLSLTDECIDTLMVWLQDLRLEMGLQKRAAERGGEGEEGVK